MFGLVFNNLVHWILHNADASLKCNLYNSRVCEIIMKTQVIKRVLNVFQFIKSGWFSFQFLH